MLNVVNVNSEGCYNSNIIFTTKNTSTHFYYSEHKAISQSCHSFVFRLLKSPVILLKQIQKSVINAIQKSTFCQGSEFKETKVLFSFPCNFESLYGYIDSV